MKQKIIVIFILIFTPLFCFSQEKEISSKNIEDTTKVKKGFFNKIINYLNETNIDKTKEKKFDFSVIGGPHYASNIGFGVGVVASGLYRLDRKNFDLPPSNASIVLDATTTGYFLFGMTGNNIIKNDKFRIDYDLYFYSMPTDFWGWGYENGKMKEHTSYKRLQAECYVDFLYKILPNTFVGGIFNTKYIRGKDFEDISYLKGQDPQNTVLGLGGIISYDTRDVITEPHKGLFIKLHEILYPRNLGNEESFYHTELVFDYYKKVWKNGILAFDLHGISTFGEVPWSMLALMGDTRRMRGYYEGRYRDKNLITAQVELRQKVYKRNGIALWVGAGNIFPKYSELKLSQTLPNVGIGYRWEFKKRVNIRLDLGFGRDNIGFVFNINEAF